MKLSNKHKAFVAEYLVDFNATKAAQRAGYSPKSAHVQGCNLLKHPKIAAVLAEKQRSRLDRLEITADNVLNELKLLAFARMDSYVRRLPNGCVETDLSDIRPEDWAAIQEFTIDQTGGGAGDGERRAVERVRFKLADKGLNLERLGRHLKLFTDKVEHSGLDGLAERMAAGRKAAAAEADVSEG